MKTKPLYFISGLLVILFSFGCQPQTPINPVTGAENPIIEQTIPAAPEAQPTAIPVIPTVTMAPTAEPAPLSMEAEVAVATLNLRGGPSLLHNIISQYKQGEVVTVIARAPGNEWVKILAKDNKTGWMSVVHLTLKQDIGLLPIFEINESLVIKGNVVDASGNGIPGIQVAVTRLGGAQRVRVDGISLPDGAFYAYAPIEYQGTWLASVVGVNCESPIVDVNCRFAGVFSPAEGFDLTLPTTENIKFEYK